MDFPTFRYYEVQGGNKLGPAQYGFTIPAQKYTVFGVYLNNLDESRKNINLTEHSCIWLIVPGSAKSEFWRITKVLNGTLEESFDFQVLEYGKPTLVFFGKTKGEKLANNIAAVNILLHGKIGDRDYGQNIPFISLYLSP